ncbi:MAG: hypothetical protein JNK53_04615 [Phycisphaerae bacterium]|nr:hypothetical protein [Phycisphaerae bacterium]
MTVCLAWIPFLQPAPGAPSWWWLLVLPLTLFVSMAWKAVRLDKLDRYWPAVFRMGSQVILGMIGLFVALAIVIRVIVPLIPGD